MLIINVINNYSHIRLLNVNCLSELTNHNHRVPIFIF